MVAFLPLHQSRLEHSGFECCLLFDVANTQGELPILVFRGAQSLGLLLCKVCTAPENKLPGGQAHQIQFFHKALIVLCVAAFNREPLPLGMEEVTDLF